MSLLTTSTPWSNDDNSNNKKRIPQIRKTVKSYAKNESLADSYVGDSNSMKISNIEAYTPSADAITYKSPTPEDTAKVMEDRNKRVYELINHITSVSGKDAGAGLADFRPPPLPVHTQDKKLGDSEQSGEITGFIPPVLGQSSKIDNPMNALQQAVPVIITPDTTKTFSPYSEDAGARYFDSYEGFRLNNNKNGSNNRVPHMNSDTKLTEKLNYMIRLLEELKVEKTDNVMEEFIMFSMLGVFVIFVLDSFSKSAKYVR